MAFSQERGTPVRDSPQKLPEKKRVGLEEARSRTEARHQEKLLFRFFCTLVTGPKISLSLKLSDARVLGLKDDPASKKVDTHPVKNGSLVQGYLAHKKTPLRSTLQKDYA